MHVSCEALASQRAVRDTVGIVRTTGRLAAMAFVLVGCRAPEYHVHPDDAERGDLVVVARSSSGDALDLTVEIYDPDRGVRLDAHDGDHLLVWRLAPSDFIDASGRSFDPASFAAEVAVRLEPPGRCAVPAVRAPQRLTEGDRCGIPTFVEPEVWRRDAPDRVVRIDAPERVDATRARLALMVGNEAVCGREEPARLARLEVCPIGGPGAVHPREVAVSSSGVVGAVSESFYTRIDTSGTVAQQRLAPSLRFPEIGMFEDRALVTTNLAFVSGGALRAFSLAPGAGPAAVSVPELSASAILTTSIGEVLALGRVQQTLDFVPHSMACRSRDASWSCRAVPVVADARCPATTGRLPLYGATELGGGDQVAATDHGDLFYRMAGSDEWICNPGDAEAPYETSDGRFDPTRLVGVTSLGRRVFLALQGESGLVVSSFEIPFLERVGTAAVPFVPTRTTRAGRTFEYAFASAAAPTTRLLGVHGRAMRVDAAGEIVEEIDDVAAELFDGAPSGTVPRRILQSHNGWTVLLTEDGVLYRASPGSRELTALTALQGFARAPAVVASDDAGFAIFRSFEAPARLSIDTACAGHRFAVMGDPIARTVLTARGAGAGFWLAGTADTGPWLERRDASLASVALRPLPAEVGEPVELAPLDAEHVLVRSRAGALFVASPDRTERLEDDEKTEWRSASASNGVGWVGAAGRLGRVTPIGVGRWRLESDWLDRVASEAFDAHVRREPPVVAAVAANCADDVQLNLLEDLSTTGPFVDETHTAWRIVSRLGALTLDENPSLDRRSESAPLTAEPPVAVSPDGRFLVFSLHPEPVGTLVRFGAERHAFPHSVEDVAFFGRHVLAAGPHGRLTLVSE